MNPKDMKTVREVEYRGYGKRKEAIAEVCRILDEVTQQNKGWVYVKCFTVGEEFGLCRVTVKDLRDLLTEEPNGQQSIGVTGRRRQLR